MRSLYVWKFKIKFLSHVVLGCDISTHFEYSHAIIHWISKHYAI